jgi:ABC-2 type transport system ATP-binding protein
MKQVRQRTLLNISVVGDPDPAARLLEGNDIVETVDIQNGRLRVTLIENATDYSDLPTQLIDAGFKLTLFQEEELNLETAFMALTKGITA